MWHHPRSHIHRLNRDLVTSTISLFSSTELDACCTWCSAKRPRVRSRYCVQTTRRAFCIRSIVIVFGNQWCSHAHVSCEFLIIAHYVLVWWVERVFDAKRSRNVLWTRTTFCYHIDSSLWAVTKSRTLSWSLRREVYPTMHQHCLVLTDSFDIYDVDLWNRYLNQSVPSIV